MAFVGIGVTGGIGAYKAVEVVRLLQQRGHRVQAVMTRTARRFVGPLTFEAITREPVITSQFARGLNADIEHIALASEMDALVVAPATANILGKFANGIADDFLTALYLATRVPVLVAPAMNTNMWTHPAVQANLTRLRDRGVHVIDPGDGYLACGWVGAGRLAEPPVIVEAVDRVLGVKRTLAGRRILVTAGPTFEDIDSVRFLGNRSSGRMGFAVAEEAQRRGADVVLVAGPTTVEPPKVGDVIRVRSAHEMHRVVLDRATAADVVIMAAAVADYTPAGGQVDGKIEKGGAIALSLERTPDILGDLGRLRGAAFRPVLVGFAAQAGDPIDGARRKLERKQVDLVVANDITQPGAGFEATTNQITFVDRDAAEPRPLETKTEAARAILDRVERLLTRPTAETTLSK